MEEDFFSLVWGDLYKLCNEKVPLGLSVDLNELHNDILYYWILLPLWFTIYTFYITGWKTNIFPTVGLSKEEMELPEEERLTTFFVKNFYQISLDINKADSIDLRETIVSIDFEKNDQRLRVIYLYPSTVNLNKIPEHLKDDELYYLIIPWPRISDAKKIENCYFLVSSILADSDSYKSSEEGTIVPEENVKIPKGKAKLSEEDIEHLVESISEEDIMEHFVMRTNFKVYYEKEILRIREQVINKIKNILDDKGVKYEVIELQEIINKTLGRESGKFKNIWINARDDMLGDLEIWVYDNILPPNFQDQLEGNEKRKIYNKYYEKFLQVSRRFSSEKPVDYENIILDAGSIIEKFVKEYFERDEWENFPDITHDLYKKHKISRLARSDLLNLKEYYNVAKHSYKQEITEEDALHVLRLAE